MVTILSASKTRAIPCMLIRRPHWSRPCSLIRHVLSGALSTHTPTMWVSRILFCSDLLIYCPSPTTEFCLLCMQYPPFCDPTLQVCEPWTKPKPEDCKTDPSYATVDCYVRRDQNSRTPSFIQGYGRPELKNVIWSNYSTYSIWLEETYIPHATLVLKSA